MIDKAIFQASRDVARAKLSAEEAANSFGYYIDIINWWETYFCPERLILWLGIHATHMKEFPELTHNLGSISRDDLDWMSRYATFCDTVSKMISTTGFRVDLRYDLAETLTDWKTIRKYVDLPAKILDFGAGCARQGLSAYLQDRNCVYVAVDGTLAGYTLQNLMMCSMDILGAGGRTFDFLDFETVQKPFPRIADSEPGTRHHVPVWMIEEHLPERYFDVIIGAHVAYELSKYDFARFMDCVDRGLADDGIFYLRAEISSTDYRDFQGELDLHGSNLVGMLRDKGIVPISSEYNTFLTTVFARIGSRPHQEAQRNLRIPMELQDARENMQVSMSAAHRYLAMRVGQLVERPDARVAIFGGGSHPYETFVKPLLSGLAVPPLIEPTAVNSSELRERLLAFDPDALIIAGGNLAAQEAFLKEMLGVSSLPLKFQHLLPVAILLRDRHDQSDPLFKKPIYSSKELPPQDPGAGSSIFPQ